MDLNKIIFLMMLCVPMFVGAQTLTFTDHEPMGNMRTQVTRQFFRLVEQESKGRIRIDHHWNGELSSSYDAYETVREGTKADMATVVPEYDSQRMPLHQLFKSFLAGPSGEAQVALIRKAYKTIPELTEELHHAGIHPVLVATGYPVGFYSREPMADLSALKLVSQELWLGHIYLVAMNLDRWNALPPKDKRAIERAASKTYKAMGKTMDESYEQMLQQLSNEGCTVRRLTHEEVSDFVTNVRQSEVQERWVKEKESEGTAEVRRVFEKLRSLVQHSAKRKQ